MKVYYALLFSLFPFIFFAQEYSISGTILDEASNPIVYANVLLLKKADSTFTNYKGVSTDESGGFNFENIQPGDYQISASFLGYKTENNAFNLSDNRIFTLILKEDNQVLDEVTLTVKKPTLKKEVDRLVFNVANTALSEGNMLEMLRSTPGVLVINNSIRVKNTTPIVYINGRKVHLSGDELAQLLEGSSANSIKSIEVITNPSSKYDAESGAVLNIIMDKNLVTGYSGNIFTNYTQGVFPRYNAGMTHFYKTEKINVFANYSYTQNKINRESNEKINFSDNAGNITEKWNTDTNRNTWSNTHNFNLNFDYTLDDSNTLSFSTNLLFLPYFKYLTKGKTDISDNQDVPVSNFDSNNLSKDKKHNLGFDLDFVHDFSSSKLSFNAHYTTYDYNRKQDVLSTYFNAFEIPFSTAFKTEADQNTNIFTAQADHETTINESSSFSAGAKVSFIKTESDINHFDIIGSDPELNPDKSDAFNYNEDIYAAYISYEKKWNTWSFSGGVRVEQTLIEGKSPKTNENNNQDYLKWFPTVNLSHDLTENTSLYLNYKRSVLRPSYQNLNPFRYFLNDNTIATGNPNLQPAFIDHVVIGTSIHNIFSIEAYYNYTDAYFLELPIQDNEENQFIYRPTNLNNTIEYGFDFEAFFNVTEKWFVYLATSFYNLKDEANFNTQNFKKDTWSNYSELSNNFTFLKDKSLTVNLLLVYYGKNQQGFQDVSTRILTDLTIKKTIFKNKATLSLALSDLLNEQDFRVVSKYINQDNSRYFNQDNRYIKLGFSYRFGNTTLKSNERTKTSDEIDRLEKN